MSRVLVVDDEKSIRITLCAFLEKEGFEAHCAADVETALGMVTDNEYDVVVSDIVMPRLSGIDMLERIRVISPSVQIIIMTGEPTVDTAVMAVKRGADDYLIKPINRDDFMRAVRQAAHIKALIDQRTALENENQIYQRSLEKMVLQRTRELQNAMQSIISLLASVVEIRDPYTAGHQRRVGNTAAAIAHKMGLDSRSIQYMRIIGYIHDIGKIVIPTEILSKPGSLNPLEIQMIRTHSTAGFEMLSKVDLPSVFGETIYQHHERCDGSGYPRGLHASEISREAKILMVADVVEAMMSHRPYRPALGLDKALSEIRDNAGTLYSPDIVSACIALFSEDQYVVDNKEHSFSFPLSQEIASSADIQS